MAYFNLAGALLAQGKIMHAIDMYRTVLALQPGMMEAWSNLALLLMHRGDSAGAKECCLRAIKLQPSAAIPWYNLAALLKGLGDAHTALQYYRECLRLAPDYPEGWTTLGSFLKEAHNIPEAKVAYERALAVRPVFPVALGNLASCHFDMGDMDTAIGLYAKALEQQQVFPDVWNNLGNAYREKGDLKSSIYCYRSALQQAPRHPHAYNNLGNSLKDIGHIQEAIHCYVTACNIMPNFAAAHSNLASVLKEQGEVGLAIAHYKQALAADPTFADAWSNLGNTYKDLVQLDDAIVAYSTAVRLRPTNADAWSNLASAYKDSGRTLQAIVAYEQALKLRPVFLDAFANLAHARMLICDWTSRMQDFETVKAHMATQMEAVLPGGAQPNAYAPHGRLPPEVAAAQRLPANLPHTAASIPVLPSVQPFHSLVYPLSLAEMKRLAQCYAQRVERNLLLLKDKPVFTPPTKGAWERLRVGYVSSDFGNHPLSHLMQSIFGMHNRARYEVFGYALSPDDGSQWRRKVASEIEHFKDLSAVVAPGDAAKIIAADRIHILINLNGYTKGARNEIFALRPAPVQVSYMGFCGTTGAPHMDYFIVDESVVPRSLRQHYTEALVFMPHCYFVNDHKQSAQIVLNPAMRPTRAQYGLPEDKFLFANFNQLYKVEPRTFAVWCRILRALPKAALWLLRFPPAGEDNIRAAARAFGVHADQIVFTDVAPKEEHLRRGALVDLFLDTPACNAHTTGCDILWAGTPLLTVPGEKMASRVAASLLNSIGLTSCIADSLVAYEQRAIELASSPKLLAEVRAHLESARHTWPLFDTARWVRNCEQSYDSMWARWEAGQPPADITVQDVSGTAPIAPVQTIVRDPYTLRAGEVADAAGDVGAGGTAVHTELPPEVMDAEGIVSRYMQRHPGTKKPTLESVVVQQPTVPLAMAAAAGAMPAPTPLATRVMAGHFDPRQVQLAQYGAAAHAGFMPAQAHGMQTQLQNMVMRQQQGFTLPPGVAAAGMPGHQPVVVGSHHDIAAARIQGR